MTDSNLSAIPLSFFFIFIFISEIVLNVLDFKYYFLFVLKNNYITLFTS